MLNADEKSHSIFVITGMHRSGTSLTASLLESAGVDIGKRLLPPSNGNVKGYYENIDFVEFHEEVLYSQGISKAGWTLEKQVQVQEQYINRAKLIVKKNSSIQTWGWKDPRATLFLNFWADLLPEAKFILMYRAPWEVIDSLYRRGNLGDDVFNYNPNFALKIWENYNQSILNFYDEFSDRCVLLSVYSITNNPIFLIKAIQEKFGISLDNPATDIYDASLLHTQEFNLQRATLIRHYFPEVCQVYQELNEKALQIPGFSAPNPEAPQFSSYETWVLQDWLDVRRLERQESKLENQLQQTQIEKEELQAQLQQTQVDLEESNFRLHETQVEVQQLTSRLHETQVEVQQLTSQLHETQVEVQQLTSRLHETQVELEQSKGELEQSNSRLHETQVEVQQLISRLHETQVEVQQLTSRLHETQVELEQSNSHLHETQVEVQQLTSRLHETQVEVQQLNSRLHETQVELEQSKGELEQSNSWLHETQGELERSKVELERSQSQLWETQIELEQSNSQLQEAQVELKQSNSQLRETQIELKRSQFQLHTTRSETERSQAPFQQNQIELEEQQFQLQQTQAKLDSSKNQLQYAQMELERSQDRIAAMESSKFWKLRTGWFKLKKLMGVKVDE